MDKKRYKAVIFDVDGTLLDTTEGIIASAEYAIKQACIPEIDRDTLLTFIGPPIQDSFMRVYGVTKEKAQELAGIFRKIYKDKNLFKAVAYQGIYELLDEIRGRGIKIGAATYKRQDYAREILEHFGFDKYSSYLFGADHENKLKKSDIIMLCINEMGIKDLKDVVMVGDSMHDATGAKALGIDFIGVTYGFGFKNQEDVFLYDAVGSAATPLEILKYI